jgi:hypothetical protein
MKNQIKTEIVINASKEKVFSILTNLQDYEKWNPFIIKSEGKPLEGARIKNTMMNGDKTITFRPRLVKVKKNEAFEWIGHLGFKGLFDGHHYFHIKEVSENQVNLIHGENFSGILSSFTLKKIGEQTRKNFISMNEALKLQAEEKN